MKSLRVVHAQSAVFDIFIKKKIFSQLCNKVIRTTSHCGLIKMQTVIKPYSERKKSVISNYSYDCTHHTTTERGNRK